jgi:hypothetical protein
MKLKNNLFGAVGVRSKVGTSFDTLKKSTGDLFTQMLGYKK